MAAKLMKLSPATYKFVLPNEEERADPMMKQEWVLAREVFDAMLGIRAERGEDKMTPGEFLKDNPHISPITGQGMLWFLNKDSAIKSNTVNGDWLTGLIESSCFIPASVGMQLIEAIRKPVEALRARLAWAEAQEAARVAAPVAQ